MNLLKKVIFLDRDGVINQDSPDYIKSWEEFEFIPGSLDALQELHLNGFTIIIITNQSAVSRKLLTLEALEDIHTRLRDTVESNGGCITDIFYCPHLPTDGCRCRKPKPGLIQQARNKYQTDLASAVMIGDSAKDIECARNAGCNKAILVRTGNGNKAVNLLEAANIVPDYIAANLQTAVQWILE